jgi:hypothetical protein
MEKPERSSYSVLDFSQWLSAGSLVIAPKFQRRPVWTTPRRTHLIDTILHGLPVPPLYLRVRQSDDRKKTLREVIDGQQRLRAVLEFIDGKFSLSKNLDAPWANKGFSQLNPSQQDQIRQFSFICEVFPGISDSDVLEIFSRVNSYSVQLNAQELRNGKYFGLFKQLAYKLAHRYLEFWRKHHIFAEQSIARMLEVELVSELLIAQIHGMQDKKKSIDKYYAQYDDNFTNRSEAESRFATVFDEINMTFEDRLSSLQFRRGPLFYSVYCVTYHRMFALPEQTLRTPRKGRLSSSERQDLLDAATRLSDLIDTWTERPSESLEDRSFVIACARQTDNIAPRKTRFSRLYSEAFRT